MRKEPIGCCSLCTHSELTIKEEIEKNFAEKIKKEIDKLKHNSYVRNKGMVKLDTIREIIEKVK